MIVAAWLATERRATNHGTPSLGTIEAGKERSAGERKAWPTPKARTKRKIGVVDNPWGRWTYQARARATMASDIPPKAVTHRRSKRSAVAPAMSTSNAAGANSANPRNPRSSSLPVSL